VENSDNPSYHDVQIFFDRKEALPGREICHFGLAKFLPTGFQIIGLPIDLVMDETTKVLYHPNSFL
jgi:hypothetical protein